MNKTKRRYDRTSLLFVAFAVLLFLAGIFLPGTLQAAGNHVVDDAHTVSSGEASELAEMLDKTSSTYGVDVVIYTIPSLSGSDATSVADDYYDYNDYGPDGILFMVSPGSRQWAISTKGTCIRAFTDAGQAYIIEQIKEYMTDGNYYKAFKEFAKMADDYLKKARDGLPYDKGDLPKKPFKGVRDAIISLLGGLGIGFGRATLLKAETKTVKAATNATGYLADYQITGANEFVTHREFHRDESSSRGGGFGGGGGSSTHISSSGSTHGGSSGSF